MKPYIMLVRKSYYEIEEILIWIREYDDVIGLLEVMDLDAVTLRRFDQ